MKSSFLLAPLALLMASPALADETVQAPYDTQVPASHRDRIYAAEQFSNTVSVSDPVDGKLLGVIRLGDPQPQNFSPLYKGQVLVHGMGFASDGKTLAVVSIGSNSVTFIDTAANAVKHTTYIGRSPHEAFYGPDGKEVWVTVRGEDYISVLDPVSYLETARLPTPGGPGMTMFSPDGEVRLHLLVVQSRAGRIRCCNPQAGRFGQSAKPLLSQHRRYARRQAGLVHAQGCRQDRGHRCAAALRYDQGARYRPDHEPCQYRQYPQGHAGLRHRWRSERGEGLPHRRFFPGCDDPGRTSAARHMAVGRREGSFRRPRERRPTGKDRHRHQQGRGDYTHRASPAGHRLYAQRRDIGHERHRQSGAPGRCRECDETGSDARRRGHVDRLAVRPGAGAGPARFCHRAYA